MCIFSLSPGNRHVRMLVFNLFRESGRCVLTEYSICLYLVHSNFLKSNYLQEKYDYVIVDYRFSLKTIQMSHEKRRFIWFWRNSDTHSIGKCHTMTRWTFGTQKKRAERICVTYFFTRCWKIIVAIVGFTVFSESGRCVLTKYSICLYLGHCNFRKSNIWQENCTIP